ncbi:MAG: hypothetical protein JETCAE01_23590 [Anaerolineaceae bacterium]|nr:MAG: hypothetical protein EDM79_13485 [Chloroflexota bacterium]MCE7861399.1 hypothetical protein [Chloroflexi bacterium CFX2]GJQ36349.1 MAG: hypothetical protein JETCAE01_23590 [Anaerolineaceae bacterium]
MKANHFLGLTALLLVLLVILLALANFNPPAVFAKDVHSGRAEIQSFIPASQVEDDSEIGSTDGILVMGLVIVLIVTLPLFFRKRK